MGNHVEAEDCLGVDGRIWRLINRYTVGRHPPYVILLCHAEYNWMCDNYPFVLVDDKPVMMFHGVKIIESELADIGIPLAVCI